MLKCAPMQKDIHPKNYRPVVFLDNTSGATFLISSTVATEEKIKWEDGNEYPLFRVEISSASHPFYTGKNVLLDTTGRVQRFRKKVTKSEEVKKARPAKKAPRAKKAQGKKSLAT